MTTKNAEVTGITKYEVRYRYEDGAEGMAVIIATSCANAEHFILDGKDGSTMKRPAALAVAKSLGGWDFITVEAALRVANAVIV